LRSFWPFCDIDDGETGVGDPRIAREASRDAVSHGSHALGEGAGEGHGGQQVEGVLLGELGEQSTELLERPAPPGADVGVDPEVDPRRGHCRVDDAVRDRGLHGHVLEVDRPRVEEQRLLPIVDGDLADGGGHRRNQNACPAPSCARFPLRRWRTWAVGLARRCRRNIVLVMSAIALSFIVVIQTITRPGLVVKSTITMRPWRSRRCGGRQP
jgi:hypothetical protein